ncbi:hypothetical protein MKEN_01091200 [Mycena kentingensis (nom. inval.)]|nr:hypothetical protein MKEN_01091200 [Mycena kentingensis (nom. inval.)]
MSPTDSAHRQTLSNDIRALTNALCRTSSLPRAHSNVKRSENVKMYLHIATLLTRDGMPKEEEDMLFSGVALREHFALFAFRRLGTELGGEARVETSERRAGSSEAAMEHLFAQGLRRDTDLLTHFADVLDVLRAFAASTLPEDARELQQTKCLVFFTQRSLGPITRRFHQPKKLFASSTPSWWRILTAWEHDLAEFFPVHVFSLKPHIALILNALSPNLVHFGAPFLLDEESAKKCVDALVVLLDVVDRQLKACAAASQTRESWETLNTTMRMLYSLVHETEVIRHILTSSSFSTFLVSRGRDASIRPEKRDGPALFRELQGLTAWQRAVIMLTGTKIFRAAVPIKFHILSIPSGESRTTPVMDLVNEIYPSWRYHSLAHIKAYIGRLVLLGEQPVFTPHFNTDVMGAFLSTNEASREMWALQEGVLQILGNSKSCCYACDKFASLLTVAINSSPSPTDSPASPPSFLFVPWSPPPNTPTPILEALRADLVAELKRHLDCVVPSSTWSLEDEIRLQNMTISTPTQTSVKWAPRSMSHSELSVLQVLGEMCT